MSRLSRKEEHPPVPPVKTIEVSDSNRKWKIVAIVLLLALGVTLIATAIAGFLTTEPGWETIQAGDVQDSCAGDFVFLYLLGDGEKAPNLEQREIAARYTQLTKDAYQIFHEEQLFEGVHNVAYLNAHPNEEVEIPKVLYDAFATLEQHQNRQLYLAPLYQEYIGLFLSDEDWNAELYDPTKNAEQQQYFDEVLSFTGDENAVALELLGNNRVKLRISDAYVAYAATHEITQFINFYWMKNAFIADYLAQGMISAGYTKGTISSFDGFSRNLDTTEQSYQFNLFDRVGEISFRAGTLGYSGVKSFVSLRNYPMSELAVQLYYQWADGSFTSCHIDPADGKSKSAINDLTGYSRTLSCAEVLLRLCPVYMTENLDTEALAALPGQGVETVYCKDSVIYTSDAKVTVTELYEKDSVKYTWQKG